jgi:hypothetical protein
VGEKWQTGMPLGVLFHEIVLNPKLGASDFSLAPAGYTFEKQVPATVTEDEMVAYPGLPPGSTMVRFPIRLTWRLTATISMPRAKRNRPIARPPSRP